MKKRGVVAVAVGVALIVAAWALWTKPWTRDGPSKPGGLTAAEASEMKAAKSKPPGYEFDSLRLAGSHKGVKQWELIADSVSTDDTAKLATVQGIRRVAVYRDGKPYLTGSADGGIFHTDTRDVIVEGDIKLKNDKGDTFATQSVTWSADAEQLQFPKTVEMVLDGRKITADRATADIKAKQVTAEGNVTIEGPGELIRSGKLIYDDDDKSMRLIGDTSIQLEVP